MSEQKKVIVIGAGHAGGNVVAFLRQYGFDGSITLVGEEPVLPYHRPPLSKAWLKGETTESQLLLKPEQFYTDQNITVKLGVSVCGIDRDSQTVLLSNKQYLEYDYLIVATGARARELPARGADLDGVCYLRDLAEASALKKRLHADAHLVIIGAGYIGLEVAASARLLGAKVTVIERESRLLARVASEPLSDFYQQVHEQRGVEFILQADIEKLQGAAGKLKSVCLADGQEIDCDLALIGIGAIPNDQLAQAAGLVCNNGIVVDDHARSSDPAIFAIGDVSNRPLPVYDYRFRLENISNTLEQAKQVASSVSGFKFPALEVPWFWSDQYEHKLQIAGLAIGSDVQVVRNGAESHRLAIYHFKGDRLLAVEAVNMPSEFMFGKKCIVGNAALDIQKLSNSSIALKDCLRAD